MPAIRQASLSIAPGGICQAATIHRDRRMYRSHRGDDRTKNLSNLEVRRQNQAVYARRYSTKE
ncbi:hypothetical protein H8B02_27425 [Bradyrhizobium sp. Pear77]|uniref:hypothetical protein n=1 Tax=Bradyrhizobium altum TaxID=1571202 RepID=UPI001E36AE32|nr:hypothetical protein [Bradyrhizobium altum]MCC8957030.1 hypothetical protein [Bradyrhizobium altum]